jgi:hypothetical protein
MFKLRNSKEWKFINVEVEAPTGGWRWNGAFNARMYYLLI